MEFNRSIRAVDPLEDFAFLPMGLEAEGRLEEARIVTLEYFSHFPDLGGLSLLPLFEIYRASVRAKVDCILLKQGPDKAREDYLRNRLENYLRFMSVKLQHSRASARTLRVMMGLPASGKSLRARKLQEEHNCLYFASDIVRKRMFHIGLTASSRSGDLKGIYTPEITRRLYRRLGALARIGTRNGFDVILDATYSRNAHREHIMKLAERFGLELEFYWVQADEETTARRLEKRKTKQGISELTDIELWKKMRDSFDDFTPPPGVKLIRMDSSQPAEPATGL